MKPWMKMLMWFGLGGAVGFFAGQQIGYNKAKKEDDEVVNDAYDRGKNDGARDMIDSLKTETMRCVARELGYITPEEEDAEMPMDPPEMPDDDEPVEPASTTAMPFHPTMLIPEIVTEEQFCDRVDLDEELILWYELDDVLYDVKDQKPLGPEDQANSIGLGAVHEFYSTVGGIKDEVFVINEALGTRYRIQRIEDAFIDAVDGGAGPEEDYEDDTE
jgi:hypothetical protein